MFKTMGMMKAIVKFHENCIRLITDSARAEKKISMGYIEQTLGDVVTELTRMKFKLPEAPEHETRKYFDNFHEQIDSRFRDLQYN
jgi:vacuolar-type H+-ATPase catalytic subunit A/Vma1